MENFSVFIAHHMGLFYLLSVTLIALMAVEFLRAKRAQTMIGPKDAVLMINRDNAVVIDIRSKDHFKGGHIVDAINAPLQDWVEASKKLGKYKSKPVIVVCQAGQSAQKAAAALAKNGYTAYVLSGGMRAWTSAELPLIKE